MTTQISNFNVNVGSYALITAAHNEEDHIEKTIISVVSQSVRPMKWVIVNDRSNDRTEEIIKKYQRENEFILLLTVTGDSNRNFAAQVRAINKGYDVVKQLDYDFIGNIDADISFENNYFEHLLNVFKLNSHLGLTGGVIFEQYGGIFKPRKSNNPRSVPHAVQLFRRSCFECVGGYKPFKYGGPDWYAEVMARMNGWEVQTTQELPVFHHRPSLGAENVVRGSIRVGLMAYSFGSHPLFEFLKSIKLMQRKPYLLHGLLRLAAFLWATCSMRKREVSDDFMKYLRHEQSMRMRQSIRRSFLVCRK
jgi:glycosyltransferase involved in cell wall biosynthesis